MNNFISSIMHLTLSGAFIILTLSLKAQVNSWQILENAAGFQGIGIQGDSLNIYSAANNNAHPYNSYLFGFKRSTGQRDSILVSSSDTASFLPFYIDVEDSNLVFLGANYDWTVSRWDTGQVQTVLMKLDKNFHNVDSVHLKPKGFNIGRYFSLGEFYYISLFSGGLYDNRITRVNKTTFEQDTSIALDMANGGSPDISMAFISPMNKLFAIANPGRAYLIDTTTWVVDSTFFPWDSTYPYAPVVRDLFYFNDTLTALASPWGMRLYKYDDTKAAIMENIGVTNNDTMGAEQYLRGCYGIVEDSLLIFSTAGPFTAPPPLQTHTITYIKIYAVNSSGKIVWQQKIENGRNNLVHSQFTDDQNTFVYVRSYSVDIPSEPSKMIIYKLNHQGDVLSEVSVPLNHPSNVRLYPNPANTQVFYTLSGMRQAENFELSIYTLEGKEKVSFNLKSTQGRLDVSELAEGHYIYALSKNNRNFGSGKLIIKR